jgi:hypothetical protein
MSDIKTGENLTQEEARKVLETLDASKFEFDHKPFASLFHGNETQLTKVFEAIEDAIWKSVALDIQREPFGNLAQRGMTKAEIKHRFLICEKWIRHARGDLGFGVDKTLDLLGHALRHELDGYVFDPNNLQTRLWTPT